MVFKVIIAGGRDFYDYNFLKEKVDNILSSIKDEIEIVSGAAKGADALGERYAKERGYKLKLFPAQWSIGKAAGPLRNEEMAKYADACICFWDGSSRGTSNMIDNAKKHNLKLRVINY
jgi:hypothetical protein